MRDLKAAATAPLTVDRFFSNILKSVDNARLRIPPDPEAAYHRFCGPGIPREVRVEWRDGGSFGPDRLRVCDWSIVPNLPMAHAGPTTVAIVG
jgi:hypothetical protein